LAVMEMLFNDLIVGYFTEDEEDGDFADHLLV
jgi:hypothetical protein